jgi:hypothetical protein
LRATKGAIENQPAVVRGGGELAEEERLIFCNQNSRCDG